MENELDFTKIEEFDWDEGNIDKNWERHSITNKEAEEIFVNKPQNIFKDVSHSGKEDRFAITGITNSGKLLIVFFTLRKGKFRIISARNQSKKERKEYEKIQNST